MNLCRFLKRVLQLPLFIIALLCAAQPLLAEVKQLKIKDVRSIMEEMMSYHIECKELTPLIVKRSFKIYIEQFDPEKLYLLEEEVTPFLELSSVQIEGIIHGYRFDDFSSYQRLNDIIVKAIDRAWDWRQEMARELIFSRKDPDLVTGESYLSYAPTEALLQQRIKKQLVRFLLSERPSLAAWNSQKKEKVFALYEKRLNREERSYTMQERKEHFLALHVLKALSKSLDAHTAFFSPEEAYEMKASLEKQFEGIGVVLREGIDGVTITGLIKGGPADKCGKIVKGDLIVEVDKKSTIGSSYEEVLTKIKGEGNRKVFLGLRRYNSLGTEENFTVELAREKIVMQDERLKYTAETFGNGIIGKITLPSFYESGDDSNCEKDMREAIKDLKKRGDLLGIIIDLRENSGGFLNQAVKVAGLFITSGVIVISKYSDGEVQYLREVDGRSYFNGPVIILTSKASASAAEIVAQALQDYGSALVVGDERTYGKGTIQYQTVTDADANAFFKVTVGKYYTVSGRSTQIEGVKADILVPTPYAAYNIGERFMEYPLSNDRISPAYADPLTDLDERSRVWFHKNYLPNLQKMETFWKKILPLLKENSDFRLSHDKNFKLFLSTLESPKVGSSNSTKDNWGIDDIQMSEAVNILKDMIYLETTSH